MQSIHVCLDIAKFAEFWWKIPDVNETQEVRHSQDSYTFGFFLGKV